MEAEEGGGEGLRRRCGGGEGVGWGVGGGGGRRGYSNENSTATIVLGYSTVVVIQKQ